MKILTKEQHHILIEKGTEIPFTGKLLKNKEKGVYMKTVYGSKRIIDMPLEDSLPRIC